MTDTHVCAYKYAEVVHMPVYVNTNARIWGFILRAWA